MKRTLNPYRNTKKRRAALAWMASKGITQPRPLYPVPVLAEPVTLGRPMLRRVVSRV